MAAGASAAATTAAAGASAPVAAAGAPGSAGAGAGAAAAASLAAGGAASGGGPALSTVRYRQPSRVAATSRITNMLSKSWPAALCSGGWYGVLCDMAIPSGLRVRSHCGGRWHRGVQCPARRYGSYLPGSA
ncbi:MAG: hypothetical protein EBR18_00755 [Betaproteobacteria bacterium]|nr:hypothetical protein [Betaproteobacteria bacterium]